eukprot:scaffold1.g5892.t1
MLVPRQHVPAPLLQETFDAAVKENIEEFEMEEFEAQGADLGNIIKSLAGGDLTAQPGAAAVATLTNALAEGGDGTAVAAALAALQALLDDAAVAQPSSSAELLTVLHHAEAVEAVLRVLEQAGGDPEVATAALGVLAALLASRDHQAAFRDGGGAAALHGVLARHADNADVAAAALAAAAAAATKSEDNKNGLLDAGLAADALAALDAHAGACAAVRGACALLAALTTADDDTQPGSRAFANARGLAKDGAAAALVAALRRCTEGGGGGGGSGEPAADGATTVAVCGALRQVAANDEICQEVASAGGVHLALGLLDGSGARDAGVARAAAGLLRQLASSDGNKAVIVEEGGLERIGGLLREHAASTAMAEQALGLLTNVTLRNPEAAQRAVDCGCATAMLGAMRGLLDSKENRAQAAERQACMALRNIVARNPNLRPVLLDAGAERLLRAVKAAYPSCRDAGSAALRDLGLDNYND